MAVRQGALVTRCPYVSKVQAVVGGRWRIELLYYIGIKGVRRFGAIKRRFGGISDSTLSKQLRELDRDGLTPRHASGEVPPRVEYGPTPRGEGFVPALEALCEWGEREFAEDGPS